MRLSIFKNLHLGETCVIVCNGPSLNDVDSSKFNGKTVFCLNRGYLKKGLRYDYHVSIDDLIIRQFRDEFSQLNCDKFSGERYAPDVYILRWTPDIPKFSTDITKPIWQGHSVTNVALQIAFYMGFDTTYIVGMDHFISYDNTEKYGGKYKNLGEDKNHFSKDYFSGEAQYNHQNLAKVELGYKMARLTYERYGRKLFNASTVTALSNDIIPRCSIEELSK